MTSSSHVSYLKLIIAKQPQSFIITALNDLLIDQKGRSENDYGHKLAYAILQWFMGATIRIALNETVNSGTKLNKNWKETVLYESLV